MLCLFYIHSVQIWQLGQNYTSFEHPASIHQLKRQNSKNQWDTKFIVKTWINVTNGYCTFTKLGEREWDQNFIVSDLYKICI